MTFFPNEALIASYCCIKVSRERSRADTARNKRLVLPLSSYPGLKHYVYIGTMSKVVAPALLKKYLSAKAGFELPEGGRAFWIKPKHKVDWQLVQKHLQQKGICILHPEAYSFKQTENGLRLGYAYLSEAQLEEGLKALGEYL